MLASFVAGGTALGFGAVAAARTLPPSLAALRARSRGADLARTSIPLENPASPAGRPRETGIAGFWDQAVRHTDGAYSMLWNLQMPLTLLAGDHLRESDCDELARMLAAERPAGTVLQFRRSVGSDSGEAIARHDRARASLDRVVHSAGLLHDLGVNFYRARAAAGFYKRVVHTVVARVPAPHPNDTSGMGPLRLLPAFGEAIGRYGIGSIARAWRDASADANDSIVRRLCRDEEESRARAERVFRDLERDCPFPGRRLTPREIWSALYYGHNLNATSVPELGENPDGLDLRDYLCAETIDGEGWYLMHGDYPVTIVSLFTPPNPVVNAATLRRLLAPASLAFRHTLVTEFVTIGKDAAKKRVDKRISQIERTKTRSDGSHKPSHEARAADAELDAVRMDITNSTEQLLSMRVYAVVVGDRARTRAELERSLDRLRDNCDTLIGQFRKMEGADAGLEEPIALRYLYPCTILGETTPEPIGRELDEVTDGLSAFIPAESSWSGAKRPHTICSTVTGHLTGFDLFDIEDTDSPVVLFFGQPGSGKSVGMGRIVQDVLATKADASGCLVDFGESFGPLVEVNEGRHLRFVESDVRPVNVWDYQGIELGVMPDTEQMTLVVVDAMNLARVPETDTLAEDILTHCVRVVYQNEVPRNYPGGVKHEPVLSHLIRMLKTFPWHKGVVRDRAEQLWLALEKYAGHPWLDAPTHPDYLQPSRLDVFELDSLDKFPKAVRESIAYRVAARVIRMIGRRKADGTISPLIIGFDEMWKIREKFPPVLFALRKGTRQGRKENVVVMLATHSYHDIDALWDVVATAGVRIIGKQSGNIDRLAEDAGLSPAAQAAIRNIRNEPGAFAQYVIALGSGDRKQKVEMIQFDLCPTELWTFTTNPTERNARSRVKAVRPDWTTAEVISWLATNYPDGLQRAGLAEIDEARIPRFEAARPLVAAGLAAY